MVAFQKFSKFGGSSLLVIATTCAFALPASAQGQDATPSTKYSEAASNEISEIIVTASKREQRLSEVPAAITAIGADELNNINAAKLADVVGYLPAVTFNYSGIPGIGYIGLRGIAPTDDAGSTMAFYIDDSPVSRSSPSGPAASSNLDLSPYDVERIEVLRGPQGTLYGANSLGGIFKYVLKKPSLTDFEAQFGGELTDVAHSGGLGWIARGAASVPIIEGKLALRASYGHRKDPGFVDNVAPGGKRDFNRGTADTYRAALLWKPTDDISIDLSYLRQENDYGGQARVGLNPVTRLPQDGPYSSRFVVSQDSLQTYSVFNGTLNWDFGGVTLTSATGYSRSHWSLQTDLTEFLSSFPGRVALSNNNRAKKFVQEVRLASDSGGMIEWLVGGFYTHETFSNPGLMSLLSPTSSALVPGFNPLISLPDRAKYTEYAGFGNVTLNLSDTFDIGGGLRVAHNKTTHTAAFGGFLVGDLNGLTSFTGTGSDTVTLWSATARFRPIEGTILYARAATGYRPGGGNSAFPGVDASFAPDKTTSYELGVKSKLDDGRAYIEAAIFQIDWDDIQVAQYFAGFLPYTVNAGKARSKGFEISAQLRPVEDISVNIGLSYSDAKLVRANPVFGAGQAGDPLPLVTPWTANTSIDWTFARFGDWQADSRFGLRFVDKTANNFVDPTGRPFASTVMLDANLGFSNGRYAIGVFARNIGDVRRVYITGPTTEVISEPRVLGVKFDVTI